MARWGGAQWRPLGDQTEPPLQNKDIVCLHTMVGTLYGTDSYFKDNGYSGTESHFGVGGKWGKDGEKGLDGVVYQWQDTNYQADANADGNDRIISIETGDNFPQSASDIEPWTSKQIEAIAQCVAWVCKTHNIPASLVPDSKQGRRGIGYHRQGIDPWRVDGGEVWSTAYGKECPGDKRIKQITSVIIPRVKEILGGSATPQPKKEITMYVDYHSSGPYIWHPGGKRKITKSVADVFKSQGVPVSQLGAEQLNELPTYRETGTDGGDTYNDINKINDLQAQLNTLSAKVDQILGLVTP